MSHLTDHERPLPDSVIARGADTDSAHGLNTETNDVESLAHWAVLYTPPEDRSEMSVRPCVSRDHASKALGGLPAHYLPAYAAEWRGDWQPVEVRTA